MRRVAASTDSGVLAATRQLRRPTFTLRSFSRTSAASRSTRCLPTTISSTSAALAGAGAAAAAGERDQDEPPHRTRNTTRVSAPRLKARSIA